MSQGRSLCSWVCFTSSAKTGKRATPSLLRGRQAGGKHITVTPPTSVHISLVNSLHTFYVSFTILGQLCYFLVDTGAAATLINSLTWDQILQSHKFQGPSLQSVLPRLVSVNGSPLSVKGTATVELAFNKHVFSTSVIVVENLTEDAILGLDFLEKYQCSIDLPHRRLALLSDTSPVFIPAVSPPCRDATLRAVLSHTVLIPPYSELETLATVNNFALEDGVRRFSFFI